MSNRPKGRGRIACLLLTLAVLLFGGLLLGGALFMGGVFKNAGSNRTQADVLATVKTVGAAQITSEAYALMATHKPDTQLSGPTHGGAPGALPPGIESLQPIYVLITADSVRIKIWGMGDWAGLVATKPGVKIEFAELVAPNLFWVDPSQGPR